PQGALAHIGEPDAASYADLSRMGDGFPQNQPKEAGLSAAVWALEANPVPGTDFKGNIPAYCPFPIGNGYVLKPHQGRLMIGKLKDFQGIRPFDIFQQLALFGNGSLPAA